MAHEPKEKDDGAADHALFERRAEFWRNRPLQETTVAIEDGTSHRIMRFVDNNTAQEQPETALPVLQGMRKEADMLLGGRPAISIHKPQFRLSVSADRQTLVMQFFMDVLNPTRQAADVAG